MEKNVYMIDGQHFNNFDEFFQEVSSVLIPGIELPLTLGYFNDILWGGFGTSPEGFVLIWKNSDLSRRLLGYELTAALRREGLQNLRQGLTDNDILQREYTRIKGSYPEQDDVFYRQELQSFERAYRKMERLSALNEQRQGETLFDIIVGIIREHPDIELRLE